NENFIYNASSNAYSSLEHRNIRRIYIGIIVDAPVQKRTSTKKAGRHTIVPLAGIKVSRLIK
uniref:hypothetical protein n=1 Tax=Candidatus Cryptobacteroides bacterium TaxID=3085639 RepID=UPI0040258FCA